MLLPTIHTTAAKGDVEIYQKLLRADWSRTTVSGVLVLLRKLISRSLNPAAFPWEKVLTLDAEKKSAKEFDAEILSRIRDLSLVFREPSIPAMPDRFTATRPSRLAAQAEQAWAYLMVQAMAKLEGATGLFADTQSLLYLCAAHFLLPQLQNQDLTSEHDCLVCAMYVHTLLVWKAAPAHLFDLQSVLLDHLGNAEQHLHLLDFSFLLTPPEDHAYLTRATAYWSALMERKHYEEASKFLFALTRHAPDACQEEVREMLAETIVEARNGRR